jgi:rifampicin phosphotransferase
MAIVVVSSTFEASALRAARDAAFSGHGTASCASAAAMSPEIIDRTFFGDQPDVPPYRPTPTDEDEARTAAVAHTLLWILTTTDLPELMDDKLTLDALRAARPDLGQLSDSDLVERVRSLMSGHFRRLFARHVFTTYCSTVPLGIIQHVCARVDRPEITLRLVSGLGDVESAEPSWALWDVGRLVAENDTLTREFEAGTADLLPRLRMRADAGDTEAGKLLARFEDFLDEFGYRGPNEWEAARPTWETAPELALACVDRMRLAPTSSSPMANQRAGAEERERLTSEILDDLRADPDAQQQLAAALRAAGLFLAGRERSKTNAIRLVHEGRLTIRELGRRLVERGQLDRAEELLMLRHDELDAYLVDPADWRDEIRSRAATYTTLGHVDPPFVFEGTPPPLSTSPPRDRALLPRAQPGTVLTGLPGCPGRATGRARVLLDSRDPTSLRPSDVLVAPITDPSWTPLFVPAAAVVVDVGAPLSHAAIVSRELGIPCVVSVTDATRTIPEGALISVDGDAGTVTILDPS